MKKLLALLTLTLALGRAAFAAEQLPLFNATLTVGKEHRFVLVNAGGKPSSFLRLGETFEGYTLKSYDPKTGVLQIERDGRTVPLTLVADALANAPAPAATPATLADAQAVLNAMNFEVMMNKTLDGVRKGQTAMVEQMMGRMLPPQADAEMRREVIEFQKKMINELMGGLSGEEMKNDIAKAYSEVFTKEELQSLGTFYQSPIGQVFSDKTPLLQEKMNAVMAPRMMAAMPKVQQMMRDFSMEQRAKREAAKGGGAPAPAPAPAPTK